MTGPVPWLWMGLALCGGFCAGWLHFRSLWPLASWIVSGDRRAPALQLVRLAALGAFLVLCAQGGGFVLLSATAGVLAGRSVALRVVERGTQ